MKTIELIRVRTGNNNSLKDLEAIKQITASALLNAPAGTVEVYKHASVEGDFAYFFFGDEETIGADGSSLGIKIRKSLESLGIVDNSHWTLIE